MMMMMIRMVMVVMAVVGVAAGVRHESGYHEECITRSFTQTPISEGAELPSSLHLHTYKNNALFHAGLDSKVAGSRVLLLGVPFGMETHALIQVLGYVKAARTVRALGIERIHVIISGNIHEAEAVYHSDELNGEPIHEILDVWADSDGAIGRALGLVYDARPDGMGIVAERYALLVDGGKVVHMVSEPFHSFAKTSHEALLPAIATRIGQGDFPPSYPPSSHDEL